MDLPPLPQLAATLPSDVVVHVHQSGTATWALVAPYIVALIALAGTVAVLVQKHRSDTREHWWQRFSWALERVLDPVDAASQNLGLSFIEALVDNKVTPKKDQQIVASVILPYLTDDSGQGPQEEDYGDIDSGDHNE